MVEPRGPSVKRPSAGVLGQVGGVSGTVWAGFGGMGVSMSSSLVAIEEGDGTRLVCCGGVPSESKRLVRRPWRFF